MGRDSRDANGSEGPKSGFWLKSSWISTWFWPEIEVSHGIPTFRQTHEDHEGRLMFQMIWRERSSKIRWESDMECSCSDATWCLHILHGEKMSTCRCTPVKQLICCDNAPMFNGGWPRVHRKNRNPSWQGDFPFAEATALLICLPSSKLCRKIKRDTITTHFPVKEEFAAADKASQEMFSWHILPRWRVPNS
jgi:hypothetical protein